VSYKLTSGSPFTSVIFAERPRSVDPRRRRPFNLAAALSVAFRAAAWDSESIKE
jgi:hypothetical protein